MFIDDLSPERRDEMIEWVAGKIRDYGMISPAMLFAEGFRPLTFLTSQAIHFVAPVGDTLTGHPYMSEVGFLLQDRDNLDKFLDRLEEMAIEEDMESDDEDDDDDDPDDEDKA